MTLYLDTTNFEQALIGLKQGDKVIIDEKINAGRQLSKRLLPIIDDLLRQQGILKREIKEIEVELGPGSFTGIRIGVAVANALAYALDIAVNQSTQLPVVPFYGSEPKITFSAKNSN